ncbi:RNA helicase [Tulasnella sp. JGI-2019a]|nr:RNA helicase [Tulasnella sp. JGI-2019a]
MIPIIRSSSVSLLSPFASCSSTMRYMATVSQVFPRSQAPWKRAAAPPPRSGYSPGRRKQSAKNAHERRRRSRSPEEGRRRRDSYDPSMKYGIPQSLLNRLQIWPKSPETRTRLRTLGLSEEESSRLIPHFINNSTQELKALESSKADDEVSGLWTMDILDTQLGRAGDMRSRTVLLDRSILHRFLIWVSSQPDASSDSPQIIDNVNTFSPYANLGAIGRLLDLRNPAETYARARRMKRKIVMHVGPTNSGKTYNALVALAKAKTGLYAGPLRLLAHEVYDRLNKGLIAIPTEPGEAPTSPIRKCNLTTGEERRVVDVHAPLTSATVEMINLNMPYGVVVLDEIQMIADPMRGDAWTRAFLGVRAEELHLCGEETVVDLIRALVLETGDELIINRYQRLTPLMPANKSLQKLGNITRGDCVVAFSRAQLFQLKYTIEKETGLKCAMVYGSLPPEVRAEQALLFNDPDSGYDVMVASDAVGMGLNLKIKRIVFASLSKFNGFEELPLSVSQTKQIAGRAGRFGLHHGDGGGEVTTLHNSDLKQLKRDLAARLPSVPAAVIKPSQDMVERLSSLLPPDTSFGDLMKLLKTSMLVRAPYETGVEHKDVTRSLDLVEKFYGDLTASDCMTLIYCPLNMKDPVILIAATNMARAFAVKAEVSLEDLFKNTPLLQALHMVQKLQKMSQQGGGWSDVKRRKVADELAEKKHAALRSLESLHKAITSYLWMSYRVPPSFPEQERAMELKLEVESAIEFYLTLVVTSGGKLERKPFKKTARSLQYASGVDVGDGVDLLDMPHTHTPAVVEAQ